MAPRRSNYAMLPEPILMEERRPATFGSLGPWLMGSVGGLALLLTTALVVKSYVEQSPASAPNALDAKANKYAVHHYSSSDDGTNCFSDPSTWPGELYAWCCENYGVGEGCHSMKDHSHTGYAGWADSGSYDDTFPGYDGDVYPPDTDFSSPPVTYPSHQDSTYYENGVAHHVHHIHHVYTSNGDLYPPLSSTDDFSTPSDTQEFIDCTSIKEDDKLEKLEICCQHGNAGCDQLEARKAALKEAEEKKDSSEKDDEKSEAKEEKPTAVEEKPAAVEEKPAAEEEKPAAVEEKPAAVEEKPAVVEEKPAAEEEKPAAVKEKPKAEPALAVTDVEPATKPAEEPKPTEKTEPTAEEKPEATAEAKPAAAVEEKPEAPAEVKPAAAAATVEEKPEATAEAKPAAAEEEKPEATAGAKPAAAAATVEEKPEATAEAKPAAAEEEKPEATAEAKPAAAAATVEEKPEATAEAKPAAAAATVEEKPETPAAPVDGKPLAAATVEEENTEEAKPEEATEETPDVRKVEDVTKKPAEWYDAQTQVVWPSFS